MTLTPTEPVNRESPFDVTELFFSTTDRRGVLTAWNQVFMRVAAYKAEELKGQPHNIVRHPDMPRCVFHLLWEYLLAGKSVGAYVKNMAKTGEFYWVFALASPHEDGGFISLRLKPTSELLRVVEQIYAELLERERSFGRDWRTGMGEAGTLLSSKLHSLGFAGYDDFMAHALRSEFLARKAALAERSLDEGREHRAASMLRGCDTLLQLRKLVGTLDTFLQSFVVQLNSVALNSGIRAVRLGDAGKALAVIGDEVARLSRSIGDQAREVRTHANGLESILHGVSFNVSLAALHYEMVDVFAAERALSTLAESEEALLYGRPLKALEGELAQCASMAMSRALSTAEGLRQNLAHFGSFVDFLGKTLLTIQFSHVTGKTQAARVPGGGGFAMLLEDLIGMTESARRELETVRGAVEGACGTVGAWQQSAQLSADRPV